MSMQYAQYVLLFLVVAISNFTELHALTVAAHSYALLYVYMEKL